MTILTMAFTRPRQLLYWQWGKLVGALLLPLTGVGGLLGALALHVAGDFTFQTDLMARRKALGCKVALALHALVAGGLPGLLLGGLLGGLVGFVTHYAIDSTGKFGLGPTLGPIVDQAAHVAVLVVLGIFV